jgi:hypothetical protein
VNTELALFLAFLVLLSMGAAVFIVRSRAATRRLREEAARKAARPKVLP